jgi:hypothetical protein
LNQQVEAHGPAQDRLAEQGQGGLYELAQELTDKFERMYEGTTRDEVEWYDTIEAFIKDKLYS